MGAKKNINVTGTSKNTAASTASGDITVTHFKIYSAATDGTAKSNWVALTTPRTVSASGMLNVADAGVAITLGAAGTANKLTDATLILALDNAGFANSDYIAWSTDGANETAYIARTSVDAWDGAIAY